MCSVGVISWVVVGCWMLGVRLWEELVNTIPELWDIVNRRRCIHITSSDGISAASFPSIDKLQHSTQALSKKSSSLSVRTLWSMPKHLQATYLPHNTSTKHKLPTNTSQISNTQIPLISTAFSSINFPFRFRYQLGWVWRGWRCSGLEFSAADFIHGCALYNSHGSGNESTLLYIGAQLSYCSSFPWYWICIVHRWSDSGRVRGRLDDLSDDISWVV